MFVISVPGVGRIVKVSCRRFVCVRYIRASVGRIVKVSCRRFVCVRDIRASVGRTSEGVL